MDEKRIEQLMESLDISYAEAVELIKDDEDIDHGKPKDFDLTPEQQKNASKYLKSGNYTRKTEKKPRERKENPTKSAIIALLSEKIAEFDDFDIKNVNITKKEREIDFSIGETNYTITLVQHRPPKDKK